MIHVIFLGLMLYNYYLATVVSTRVNIPIIKINDSLSELSKLPLKFASQLFFYNDFYLKVSSIIK